jgi:hypothetical protein
VTYTPTNTPTSTPSPQATETATATATATRRPPTATPTRPAPALLAPDQGERFVGYSAQVILMWSEVPGLREGEYYVVSIPYNEAGEVAEFWRDTTSMRVPSHFSGADVGFPDRHYNWYVQVKRCTSNCLRVLDDNVRKTGEAVGPRSEEGLFFWGSDIIPGPTPTKTPPGGG